MAAALRHGREGEDRPGRFNGPRGSSLGRSIWVEEGRSRGFRGERVTGGGFVRDGGAPTTMGMTGRVMQLQ
jgi:hypothetical protein